MYHFSFFGVELDVKNERNGVFGMWENAYLSIKNPKPGLQIGSFSHTTALTYVTNFLPQKLEPVPSGKILDPYLIGQCARRS